MTTPNGPDRGPGPDLLTDVATVLQGHKHLRTQEVLTLLAAKDPATYRNWAPGDLTSALPDKAKPHKADGLMVVAADRIAEAISERDEDADYCEYLGAQAREITVERRGAERLLLRWTTWADQLNQLRRGRPLLAGINPGGRIEEADADLIRLPSSIDPDRIDATLSRVIANADAAAAAYRRAVDELGTALAHVRDSQRAAGVPASEITDDEEWAW